MKRLNFRDCKTTASSVVIVLALFVHSNPQFFSKWPLIIAIANFVALPGGIMALGYHAADKQGTPKQ